MGLDLWKLYFESHVYDLRTAHPRLFRNYGDLLKSSFVVADGKESLTLITHEEFRFQLMSGENSTIWSFFRFVTCFIDSTPNRWSSGLIEHDLEEKTI